MRAFVIPVMVELVSGCSRAPGTLLGGLAFTLVAVYGYAKIDNCCRARRKYAVASTRR